MMSAEGLGREFYELEFQSKKVDISKIVTKRGFASGFSFRVVTCRFERFIGLLSNLPFSPHSPELSLMNKVFRRFDSDHILSRNGLLYQLPDEQQATLSRNLNLQPKGNLSARAISQFHLINGRNQWSSNREIVIRGSELWLGTWKSKQTRPKFSILHDSLRDELVLHYENCYGPRFRIAYFQNKVQVSSTLFVSAP